MAIIKKILAPTDFSELSARGVGYACQLAKEVDADLIVMNIVTLDESNSVDKRELEEHKQQLERFVTDRVGAASTGLRIRQVVEPGKADTTVLHWSANETVDLIVMSTHGRGGISRMLMGSVTEQIIRKSPCPVLVVPPEREKVAPNSFLAEP